MAPHRTAPGHRMVLLLPALGAGAPPAAAQEVRANDVTAMVPSVGAVEAISLLQPGARLSTGELFVTGTVTTRHNGPYQLQVRLAEPFRTGGTEHEVRARTPEGTLVSLGTVTWVTVATGPGGTGRVNSVEYLIVWGRGGRRNPGAAVEVRLTYRVVPP